jgi:RHS repeat-associated protein
MKKQYLLILFFSLFITSVFAQPGGGGPGGGGPPGGPVTPNCPTSCKVSGGGNKCAGDIANIVLSCSEAGIVYQLKMGQSNIGSQVNGTGSAINWSVQVSGTYKVVATNTNTNCTLVMQDSAMVIINPLPTQYTVSGGGTLCYGDPGVPVTLSNSQAHVKYQLKRNGTNIGEESTGVNGTLTWPGLATDGNYTIVARDTETNCISTMSGSASVTLNVIPSTFTVAGGGTVNSTSGVTVKLNGSFKDTKYQLKLNGKNVGQPVTGNENILSWRVDAPGNYTVVAVNSTTGCKREMNGNAVVEEDRKWSVINDYAYLYKYDKRQRLIEKKLPGAQCIYMVYDNRDRLVMTQDGEQRKNNQWTFTKYDALNRPVITGLYTHSTVATQAEMSSLINTNIFYEMYTENIATHGYSNNVFPINNIDVLTVTYYDDHRFKSLINNDELNYKNNELTGQAPSAFDHVDGKITGSKTKVLNTENTYLWSATYYDDKYSIIQTATTILSGGVARNTYIVDFDGKVKQGKTILHKDGSNDQFTIKTYEYDHAGRLAETWHQINNNPKVLLSQNTYNEIGQLVTKKLHASVDNISSFKQHVDYRYNIRGWLTGINNADLNNTDGGPKDYFGMEFGYNNDIGIGAFTPQYGGNISAAKWSTPFLSGIPIMTMPTERAYTFQYDALNRMLSANHRIKNGSWKPSSAFYEKAEYDLNGNILSLDRNNGQGYSIDRLRYNYGDNTDRSSRLLSVTDNGSGTASFKDGNLIGDDYTYDDNGNLITDVNKGLSTIQYNDYLKLTEQIDKSSGEKIKTIYDANGIKLAEETFDPGSAIPKKRTDFIGPFVFEDEKLKFVQHPEGKILIPDTQATDQSVEYQYQIRDNVGNNRITFTTREKVVTFTATMEDTGVPEYTNPRVQELAAFKNLFESEIKNVNQWLNHTTPTQGNAIYLDGSESRTLGPNTLIKVFPGDIVRMKVFGKYENKDSHVGMPLASVLGALVIPATTALEAEAGIVGTELGNLLSPFLAGKSNVETGPKADLNYILFDKALNVVDFNYDRIDPAAGFNITQENIVNFDVLELEKIIDRVGYLYVYVSNESPGSRVWMDDLTIAYHKSPIVQAEDYYPFGLSMSTTAYERGNDDYKGQVTADGTGLKDLGFRQYDPVLGRFHAVDPLSEIHMAQSQYHYADNNPVSNIDVLGLESEFAGTESGQGLLKGNRHTLDYDPLKRNRQYQKMNLGYTEYESPSPDGGGFYKPKPKNKKGQGGDPRRPHPDNNEDSEEDEGIKREVRRILYRPKAKEDFDPKEITVAGPFWKGTKNTFSSTVFNNASHRRPQNQGAGSNIDLGMFINQPVVSTPLANSYAMARGTSNEEDTREYLITHLPPNEALAIYQRKQVSNSTNDNPRASALKENLGSTTGTTGKFSTPEPEPDKEDENMNWWTPIWIRAAYNLADHLDDNGFKTEKPIVKHWPGGDGGTCTVKATIKLADDVEVTVDIEFNSNQTPEEIMEILGGNVFKDTQGWGLDPLEINDAVETDAGEWMKNYGALLDSRTQSGEGVDVKMVEFLADVVMAPYGAVSGWITDKHWRTGNELAWWDHAFGVLDIIPGEAVARLGVVALVVKIAGKYVDLAKLSIPARNFILASKTAGLKFISNAKDEIIILASDGVTKIGRIANGVLQDLYWKHGGEQILAKIAGVKYLDEDRRLVEGSLEIVQDATGAGIRAAGKTFTVPTKSPNPSATARGTTSRVLEQMDEATKRSIMRENEAADILAKKGYDIEQNPPPLQNGKEPDYLIEGQIFDCYAPGATKTPRGIWSYIKDEKIVPGQTNKVVLTLKDWAGNLDELKLQFKDWPMEGLEEVVVIQNDGSVINLLL